MTQQQTGGPPHRFDPAALAATIGLYIKALVAVVFWIIIAATSIGGGYIVIRIVLWGVNVVLQAMGMNHG